VDLHDAEVVADLGTRSGRGAALRELYARAAGKVEGLVLSAGVAGGDDAKSISVDYFGAADLLIGLLPALARAKEASAVVISSYALTMPLAQAEVVERCLARDEDEARKLAALAVGSGYASAKLALARLVRRLAPSAEWAGRGITVNALAPGLVVTPMTEPLLRDAQMRAMVLASVPQVMGRTALPEEIASVAAFLLGSGARYVTGQVIFVDGGADALTRPDAPFGKSAG
jgi:NAD(P)-dependent dehydrogenase (short-subunit alcohol dehydrogenase family)